MCKGFCLRSLFLLICMVLFAPLAWGACGSISGNVTDSSATPIFGVTAKVFHADNRVEIASTTTSYYPTPGQYSFSGLPSGNYRVNFIYESLIALSPYGYQSEWYNNKTGFDSANNVSIGATGINASLADGGSISGTVVDGNGAGIYGAQVNVFRNDSSHSNVGSATTSFDGTYTVKGLPAGSYKVSFDRPFVTCGTIWYNAKSAFSAATPVAVTVVEDTPGIDATFPGGTIVGTVRDDVTLSPLPDVSVTVYNATSGIILPTFTMTDGSGNYSIGLPAGSYKLLFNETSSGDYISVWYDSVFTKSAATAVSVADGQTVTVDQDLHKGVTISGTVTNGTDPIEGINVYAYESSLGEIGDNSIIYAQTNASGVYTLKGLRSGVAYKINYHDSYDGAGYKEEWYNDKVSFAAANAVTAPAANINAVLAMGGKITGRLLGVCGEVTVNAKDASGNAVTTVESAADGAFTLKGLPSGTYTVSMGIYSFYGLTTRTATVTSPNTTTIPDVTLTMGGSIYGRITDDSGWGLANAAVGVYDGSDNIVETGVTDANGYYVVGGLPTGSYKVKVTYNGCGGFTEWYNGGALVAVTAPQGTGGINIGSGGPPPTDNVKMGGAFYPTIGQAYEHAGEGAEILAKNQDFDETPLLDLDRGLTVSLFGGYDGDFLNIIGISTIPGPFTITSGEVTIRDFAIR
jgi:hypothetical protein